MPRTVVTTTFRPSDDILRQLVAARREEVLRLQKSQADHLEDLETRGRQRIASLRGTLPGNLVTVLDELDKTHDEASAATRVARGPGQGQAGRCYRVTGKRNRRPSGFGRWPSGGAWLAGLVHPLLRYTAWIRRHRVLAGLQPRQHRPVGPCKRGRIGHFRHRCGLLYRVYGLVVHL